MNDRRRQSIVTRPDGRLVNKTTERWYLDSLVRPRVSVERLSKSDPDIVAFEATARGSRAAA